MLLLAEQVVIARDGKFSLKGAGITTIYAREIPFTYPSLFVFMRFEVTKQDRGKTPLELRIVKGDQEVAKAVCDVTVPDTYDSEQISYLPLPIHVKNLGIKEEGDYSVDVYVKEELISSHQLHVKVNKDLPTKENVVNNLQQVSAISSPQINNATNVGY
jgi:hypothetical protein